MARAMDSSIGSANEGLFGVWRRVFGVVRGDFLR
jgi:hypothetical protein